MARSFGKVEVGSGSFPIPEVEDGYYQATIKSIDDREGEYEGETFPQYLIIWQFDELDDAVTGEPIELAQFVRLPPLLIKDGLLNEKSNLYGLMEGLGCDMENPVVEPNDWIGKSARIHVENKEIKKGQNAGQVRPRISAVKKVTRTARPAAARAKATAATAGDF